MKYGVDGMVTEECSPVNQFSLVFDVAFKKIRCSVLSLVKSEADNWFVGVVTCAKAPVEVRKSASVVIMLRMKNKDEKLLRFLYR